MPGKIANKPQICLQDGTIHHVCCGRKQLRNGSLKNKIRVPLRIINTIHGTSLFRLDPPPFPHLTTPAILTRCVIPRAIPVVVTFVSYPACVLSSVGTAASFPLGKLCSSTFHPHGLGGADPTFSLLGWPCISSLTGRKYRIPATMGIGWRWAGASSWANQNQPVGLQEVLGVWCGAGRMCRVLPGAVLLPGEKAVWV